MVSPPLWGIDFFFDEDRFFADPHWIVNRIMIVRGSPIPGKLCGALI